LLQLLVESAVPRGADLVATVSRLAALSTARHGPGRGRTCRLVLQPAWFAQNFVAVATNFEKGKATTQLTKQVTRLRF
jgi:hypothetical protein